MRNKTPLLLAAAAATGLALSANSSTAEAQMIIKQPNAHVTKFEFEVHGILGFGGGWWGPGAGVRFGIPIVPNGFVPSINNMVAINFGFDFTWWAGWARFLGYNGIAYNFTIPVMLQWNFYLTPKWSIAAELGLAVNLYPWVDSNGCYYRNYWGGCGIADVMPGTAFVARYHFRDGAGFPSLTMRLGFPTGFNIGVSF